jgi:hypothetical protein
MTDMGVKLNNIYEKTYETTLVSVDPRNIEDPNFSKDQLAQSEDARVISGQVSTFEEPSVPFAFERVYDAFRHDPEVSKADAAHQAQIERIAETGAQERKRLHGNEAAFAASASQQRSFVGAERKLRGLSGPQLPKDCERPEDMRDHVPDPKPSTGFAVASKRRRNVAKAGC